MGYVQMVHNLQQDGNMTKKESEILAQHSVLIKTLNDNIKYLISTMEAHDQISQTFRQKTVKNETNVRWNTWGIRGLYGTTLLGVIVWVVSIFLTN